MEKQIMERRDFLKRVGTLFLGILFMPFVRLFGEKNDGVIRPTSMREARHYTSGDSLAG